MARRHRHLSPTPIISSPTEHLHRRRFHTRTIWSQMEHRRHRQYHIPIIWSPMARPLRPPYHIRIIRSPLNRRVREGTRRSRAPSRAIVMPKPNFSRPQKDRECPSTTTVKHLGFILPLNLLFRLHSGNIRARGGSVYLSKDNLACKRRPATRNPRARCRSSQLPGGADVHLVHWPEPCASIYHARRLQSLRIQF